MIPNLYSQQAEYAQGYSPQNPTTPTLRELLDAGIDPEIAQQFFHIITSSDFAMTRLDPNVANKLIFMFKIAILEFTMSAPPPFSIYSCSESGRKKLTSENIRSLYLLEMWFTARVSRSIGGYERGEQSKQVRESRIITTPMNTGSMTRMQRIALKVKGGGQQ